ncbi:CRTAC1 family protein [Paraglaciecola aquimarina]|uniref:CRTAC1 family protein n=1 Tax=Paraglaciecola aquimarina TaxID=1235557 RepID=A0ABU3T249_9ALTE|nr:CRTAC1 family protein [Paraglaciecola aquimarina]MDU0356300.1 CRTAC1 family protein [Paraglaciecola aquimarina]
MQLSKISFAISVLVSSSLLVACQSTSNQLEQAQPTSNIAFVEAFADFPREEKNLRQWDAAVVADLDQDGFPDLLLNDHGFAVRVMWNNQGEYSQPYDLIMGDMHGISVADFDQDGDQEIVLSRGGGSGSNARNSKIFRVSKDRQFTPIADFNTPLAMMRGRTVKFVDVDNDGDVDLLNFAFPARNFAAKSAGSKERKQQSESYVYQNNGQGELVLASLLPPMRQDGQKTLITDLNSDNIVDLVVYGDGPVKAFLGKGDFSFSDVSATIFPTPLLDVTGVAEIDYDNDGDMDLFFTRGEGFAAGETFYDASSKTWGFYTKRGKFDFDGLKIGDIINIENLQSQWPNKNLYIGESAYDYEFAGETHSGRDLRIVNSDALGFPDSRPKKGTYLGYVGNQQWKIAGDIWSPSTGIVHGVQAYTASTHKPGLENVLLENRDGQFIDVTIKQNLTDKYHSNGVTIADLDNNGYQDIVVVERGNLVNVNSAKIYLNNGSEFEKMAEHGVVSTELGAIGMSVQSVDYDLDGQVDLVVGNERGKWHLFKNTFASLGSSTSLANYLSLDFTDFTSSKPSALGAMVKVSACGSTQSQRIGATGANYSLSSNLLVHFGLGACTQPAKVQVTWSDGSVSSKNVVNFNQKVSIKG